MLVKGTLTLEKSKQYGVTILGCEEDYSLDINRALVRIEMEVPDSLFEGPVIKVKIDEAPSINGQVMEVECPIEVKFEKTNKEEIVKGTDGLIASIRNKLPGLLAVRSSV